jgi:hypothetical protein
MFNQTIIKMSLMKKEELLKAIEICIDHHSTRLTINHVKSGDVVSNASPLIIHRCCPSVINDLKAHGYSMGMCKAGLYVDKY